MGDKEGERAGEWRDWAVKRSVKRRETEGNTSTNTVKVNLKPAAH